MTTAHNSLLSFAFCLHETKRQAREKIIVHIRIKINFFKTFEIIEEAKVLNNC